MYSFSSDNDGQSLTPYVAKENHLSRKLRVLKQVFQNAVSLSIPIEGSTYYEFLV